MVNKNKSANLSIVPSFMLSWNGPGISNGYGFGEWMAERYFRDKGFYTITNEFNLLSQTSKFKRYNEIISIMASHYKIQEFKKAVKILVETNYSIENPDMFVYNLETCFFVEVKKGKDVLRKPQMCFMYLSQSILGIDSKLVYLSDSDDIESQEVVKVNFEVPMCLK